MAESQIPVESEILLEYRTSLRATTSSRLVGLVVLGLSSTYRAYYANYTELVTNQLGYAL